jgi:hypothetical protein
LRRNDCDLQLLSRGDDRPARAAICAGSARSTITAAIACGAATLAALAGCGGPGTVPLPAKSSSLRSPSASAPASAPDSARAQVIAVYTGYFPASAAAETAAPSRARAILAPYAAQPYLDKVLAQMASYRAHDEVASGYVTPHVTKVTVNGRVAQVYDCQDASHATLTNTRTGKVVPPPAGSARTYLIASLARGRDGRWRLTSLAHVAVPCKPVPLPSS